MNVEQYFQDKLGRSGFYFMGDEMPIDSNCGNSCKLAIDACEEIIEFDGDPSDCPAQYAYLGHVYSAFGSTRTAEFLNDFLYATPNEREEFDLVALTAKICQCYIFG